MIALLLAMAIVAVVSPLFGTLAAHRELRRFFAAYFVYEDGVSTVVAFSAIFAAQTLGFPMDRLIILYIVVQLSALPAPSPVAPTDRLGPRRGVMITLGQCVAVVLAAFSSRRRRSSTCWA